MKAICILLGFVLLSNQTPAHGAPSIEACPKDSVLSEEICKCDPALCTKPPCLTELEIAVNGTETPGQCCPTYQCVGCKDEEKIGGQCPCAQGAVINNDKCECVNEGEYMVDGKCVCDPQMCPLPDLCDKKSVAVTVADGCCKKTVCTPCPFDSESTNIEGGEIEDHCVCLPCTTECGFNKTVVIKKHGSGFPGSCCDLYECKKPEDIKGCIYGDVFYENGKEWRKPDSQLCKCNDGLALCSYPKEKEALLPCFVHNVMHKDSETWMVNGDDGCTICICNNGAHNCISHYCDFKENTIQLKNLSCLKEDDTYHHGEMWIEKDGCTKCTCLNGTDICDNICENDTTTEQTTTIKAEDCQPLSNCNKTCLNGFKINKRGCEICKCNIIRLGQDILTRYNISLNDLIQILDDYTNKKVTSSSTTGSTSTTTTTSTSKTVDVATHMPVVIMNRNAFEDVPVTSTTTEPSIRPTNKETDSVVYIVIAVLVLAIFAIFLCIIFVYKSRRKSSIDLSHCHYQTVNNHNNNNTIKKTDQLL